MIPFDPSAPPVERGLAHLKRGEYESAVAAFTEAIKLNPENANGYVGRALAFRSLEDDVSAVRDEEKARELGGIKQSATKEMILLLTPDEHISQRMGQTEPFLEFMKAVEDTIRHYFEQFPPSFGLDLRVACALMPGNQLIVEIKWWPRNQSETIEDGLRQRLEALPRPVVRNGPVAFASQTLIRGGSSEEHEGFGFPFASLKPRRNESLDDLLMRVGGRSTQPPSWWGKIKRCFGQTE